LEVDVDSFTGIVSYLYSRESFWLLFSIQGLIVIASTVVLRRTAEQTS